MEVTIEFTDKYDRPITRQQVESLVDYNRIIIVNNEALKIEHFENNILNYLVHYLQKDETEAEVVAELTPLVSSFLEIRIKKKCKRQNTDSRESLQRG